MARKLSVAPERQESCGPGQQRLGAKCGKCGREHCGVPGDRPRPWQRQPPRHVTDIPPGSQSAARRARITTVRRNSVSPAHPAPTRRRRDSSPVTCVPAVTLSDQWEPPTSPAAQVRGTEWAEDTHGDVQGCELTRQPSPPLGGGEALSVSRSHRSWYLGHLSRGGDPGKGNACSRFTGAGRGRGAGRRRACGAPGVGTERCLCPQVSVPPASTRPMASSRASRAPAGPTSPRWGGRSASRAAGA